MTRADSVPVLMYHSVGRVLPDWRWAELTVPASVFEDHLKWLRRCGYATATLSDLHAHVRGDKVLAPRTVVLTFDDGYVDNWTYVAPLLAKYGFTGTVLVTPEFVDPRDIVRPTLETVWAGAAAATALEVRGFVSWPELKKAVAAGTLSVQSHAMTHTWYPVGENIVDFHHPGDGVYWLDWNAFPEDKPFYLSRLGQSRVPYGTPVYEHAMALEARRYFPDDAESEHLVKFVAARGGKSFFDAASWRQTLQEESRRWREGRRSSGRFETPEERARRVEFELFDSKRVIESHLGVSVEFLVWPGGGYDGPSVDVARSAYKAVTVSSKDRWKIKNQPGGDPSVISRRGAPSFRFRGGMRYTGGRYLIQFLEEFRGIRAARKKRQLLKAANIVASYLGLWPVKTQ